MAALTNDQVQQQLTQAHEHNARLYASLDTLRTESSAAISQLRGLISQFGGGSKFDLLDIKAMQPGKFGGNLNDAFGPWVKTVASWFNMKKDGFQKALEWAQADEDVIDGDGLTAMNWDVAETANTKLYDFLYNV